MRLTDIKFYIKNEDSQHNKVKMWKQPTKKYVAVKKMSDGNHSKASALDWQ